MTYKLEDGGPAFPSEHSSNSPAPNGMTLRDYFAGQSMSGLVVHGENFDLPKLAAYSYKLADAMLEARK